MSIWSALVVRAANSGLDAAGSLSLRYIRKNNGDLIYKKHRAYKSKLIQEASRIAIQFALNEISQLYPNWLKKQQKEARNKIFDQQKENFQTLIKNQVAVADEGFGAVVDYDSDRTIWACDKYGTLVPEALMLYYKGEEMVDAGQYYENVLDGKDLANRATEDGKTLAADVVDFGFKTDLMVHIDLAPQISLSSSKNVVMTQVQGRDYTRKEMISGGDLQFSVRGEIIGNQPGVYPQLAVQKFLSVMQYAGLLTVHHFFFKQMGVTRVLIKDFSLDPPEFKNIQPYSFSCVAVEPDEAMVMKDTITQLKEVEIVEDKLGFWKKLLLNDMFQKISSNAMSSILNSSVSALTDMTSGHI